MILGIMQPYFFPYIGYFQLIHAVDRFLLYDKTQYTKLSWISRNRIWERGKAIRYIGVPVQSAAFWTPIAEINIDQREPWRRRLRNLIYYSYKRARCFEEVFPVIETVLDTAPITLSGCNASGIQAVCALLGINTQIVTDVSRYAAWEAQANDTADSNETEEEIDRKHARIFHICRTEQAETYYNAIGGLALYDKALFRRSGIELRFINSCPDPYDQFSPAFTPSLSIIDMLMHCGVGGTKARLLQYTLI